MIKNEKDESVATRIVTRWRMCIDYRKLNKATSMDHFTPSFIDCFLDRLMSIHTSSIYTDNQGFYKSLFVRVTKRRRTSLALMGCLPTREFPLEYAMCLLLSSAS